MPPAESIALFSVAALALLLIPGPAVLYIVARSLDQGRRAGLMSVLGIHTGSLVHAAAATVGLSAVLVSSATAFTVVKYAGAAYLVFLGVRQILDRRRAGVDPESLRRVTMRRIYWQGAVVNVLNPKTAVFFFAFLPQFVDPDGGSAALQIFVFGLTFIGIGLCTDGAFALLAATITRRLRSDDRALRRRRVLSGGILVALGISTAAAGHPARSRALAG